ncbi:hypothetical protein LINGRAHAP2_LOCUS13550 [Linum grandiflorum]
MCGSTTFTRKAIALPTISPAADIVYL